MQDNSKEGFFQIYIYKFILYELSVHITSIRQVQEYTYYASLYCVWYHLLGCGWWQL